MLRSLQSLRFVFIVMVFASHFCFAGHRALDYGGDCGVSFFFVLCGFVLTLSRGDDALSGRLRARGLLRRQLAKFYPLHALTLLAALAFNAYVHHPVSLGGAICSVLLVQSWAPWPEWHFALNGPSWFLSAIVFFYAVFPALCRLLLRMPARRLVALLVCFAVAYGALAWRVPHPFSNWLLYVWPLPRVFDFALGICACRLWRSAATDRTVAFLATRRWARWGADLSAVALVALSFALYDHVPVQYHCAMLLWGVTPPVIYLCALSERTGGGLLTRLLCARPLVWLGGLSFELYMTHALVIATMASNALTANFRGWTYTAAFLATLAVAVLVAWAAKATIGNRN